MSKPQGSIKFIKGSVYTNDNINPQSITIRGNIKERPILISYHRFESNFLIIFGRLQSQNVSP